MHEWLQKSERTGKAHYLRVAGSWDEFCQRYVDRSGPFVDAMLEGYRVLDKDAAIPIQRAVEVAKAGEMPLKAHGENQYTAGESGGRVTTSTSEKQDRSNSYLLRRLARDAPEILAGYERGDGTRGAGGGSAQRRRQWVQQICWTHHPCLCRPQSVGALLRQYVENQENTAHMFR